METLKKTAETLLDNESALYKTGDRNKLFKPSTREWIDANIELYCFFSRAEHERRKPSDVEWLKTIANSGTLGDKIAALALQIQVT